MKTIFLTLILLISLCSFGQIQRDFQKAEIHFKNGETLKGWIYDEFAQSDKQSKSDEKGSKYFTGTSTFDMASRYANFPTVLKKITYKENYDDGQQQQFTDDSIDFVIVNNPDGTSSTYQTLQFIRPSLDEDKESIRMDTVNRKIWAPLLKEGKLKLYGFFTWQNYKRSSWSDVYFQFENEDYAYQFYLPHKIYKFDTHQNHAKKAIEQAFRNCPYFMENLETISSGFIEDLKNSFSSFTKEEGQLIKSYPKDQRQMIEYKVMEKRSYVPYFNLYNLYMQHCGQ